MWEKALALRLMAEAAAECFEQETGAAYVPPRGDRTTKRAMETGAVFEAKLLLAQADREAAQRHACEGTRVAVAGDVRLGRRGRHLEPARPRAWSAAPT